MTKMTFLEALKKSSSVIISGYEIVGIVGNTKIDAIVAMTTCGKSMMFKDQEITLGADYAAHLIDTDGVSRTASFIIDKKKEADIEPMNLVDALKKTLSELMAAEKPTPKKYLTEEAFDKLLRPLIEQIATICKDNDVTYLASFHAPSSENQSLNVVSANIMGDNSPARFHLAFHALHGDNKEVMNRATEHDTPQNNAQNEEMQGEPIDGNIAALLKKVLTR